MGRTSRGNVRLSALVLGKCSQVPAAGPLVVVLGLPTVQLHRTVAPYSLTVQSNVQPRTHVPDCFASRRYVGKEGFPTLMFNVACSHDGHIYNVSGPHPGSRNDKTAVRYDDFVMDLYGKSILADVPWRYLDANGIWQHEKGCWLLADGGYHKWRCVRCCVRACVRAYVRACVPLVRAQASDGLGKHLR